MKKKKFAGAPVFEEFVIVRLAMLDQRHLWEAFQRVLRMTEAACWDTALLDALLGLDFEDFSRPRNRFLYRASFWPPLTDLITDTSLADFNRLFGKNLDAGEGGFLLRLCFSVYRLFEQLMSDLASQSGVIKEQLDGSRVLASAGLPAMECYSNFVAQVPSASASG